MCKYGFSAANNVAVGGVYYLPDDSGKVRPMVLVSDPYHFGYSRVHRLMGITSQYHREYMPIVFGNDENDVSFVNPNKVFNYSKHELYKSNRPNKFFAYEMVNVLKTIHTINFGMPVLIPDMEDVIDYIFRFNDICDKLKYHNEDNGTKVNDIHLSDIAELSTLKLMIDGRMLVANDILDLPSSTSRMEYLKSEIKRSYSVECNKNFVGFAGFVNSDKIEEEEEEEVKEEEKVEEIITEEEPLKENSTKERTIVEFDNEIESVSHTRHVVVNVNRPSSYDIANINVEECSNLDIRQKAIDNIAEKIASNLPRKISKHSLASAEEIRDTKDTIALWLDDNGKTALTKCLMGVADYSRIMVAIRYSGCKNLSHLPALLNEEIKRLEEEKAQEVDENIFWEPVDEPMREPIKKKKKKSNNIGPKKSYNKHQLRKAGYGCIGSMMSGRKLD